MHIMVDPVCSVFPFNMPGILRFVLLVLFHQHIQPAWSQTLALPLAVRSPYLSCWLPQIRGTAIRNYYDAPVTTISDLSKVCHFS